MGFMNELIKFGFEIGKEVVKQSIENAVKEEEFKKHLENVVAGFSFVLGIMFFYWFIFLSPYFDLVSSYIIGHLSFLKIIYPFSMIEKIIFLTIFSLLTAVIFSSMVDEFEPVFKLRFSNLLAGIFVIFISFLFISLISWGFHKIF